MNDDALAQRLESIEAKLNQITEYIEAERRRQREMQELKNDLAVIGKDVFQAAVLELDDVAAHFDSRDLLRLVKKLLRNTRHLNRLLDQMSSTADFFEDLKPIGKQMFQELLETLDQLDRRGYFVFFREMSGVLDTVVRSYSVEDVRALRDNIISILNTVKTITQPDMLSAVNNAAGFFRKMDVPVQAAVSMTTLLRQFRDPEVRRGIYFLLQFAKNMAGPATALSSTHQEN
jgi:uncharacterized protein YjgD (DUF1641 family)